MHVVIFFGIAATFLIFVACFKVASFFLTPCRSELLRFPNHVYDFRPKCIPLRSINIIRACLSKRLEKVLLHQIRSSYNVGANSPPPPPIKQNKTQHCMGSKNMESKKNDVTNNTCNNIHTKCLHSDWLRAVQFFLNIKKRVNSVQKEVTNQAF